MIRASTENVRGKSALQRKGKRRVFVKAKQDEGKANNAEVHKCFTKLVVAIKRGAS